MDDYEKIIEEAEREGIKVSQGLSKLLLKMWKNASDDLKAAVSAAKRNKKVCTASIVLSCILLCVSIFMGSAIYNQSKEIASLRGEIESIHKILDAGVVVEETTTTTETTTTVEQDTGEGSGNNVFQAGEGSSYTQDGGGE